MEEQLPNNNLPDGEDPPPENNPEEIVIDQSKQIENMEVHHHTHPGHHKKTWKEYFWEFLMLFLAVFCGFLAEYQLEHVIEKQHAKDFAVSFRQDIKHDTAEIKYQTNYLNSCIYKIDSMIMLLNQPKQNSISIEAVNRLAIYAFVFPVSSPNEATLQQLLNSGSLRYFKNKQLIDSITLYNTQIQQTKNFNVSTQEFNTQFRIKQSQVIALDPLITTYYQDSNASQQLINGSGLSTGDSSLLTNDPAKLKEFANWCVLKKFYMLNERKLYKKLVHQMEAILEMLNKDYPIE
ncbi:MAG: hypothetical protein ABIP30_16340 [Ferruginibacter sp.]